jgi:hypothetical protein
VINLLSPFGGAYGEPFCSATGDRDKNTGYIGGCPWSWCLPYFGGKKGGGAHSKKTRTYGGGMARALATLGGRTKANYQGGYISTRWQQVLYNLALVLALVPAVLVFAVVPFGPEFEVFGVKVKPILTDVNVGLLLVFALGSMAVYAIALAGWASNSKYALIGSMRKAGIIVSYEVVITFAVMGPHHPCGHPLHLRDRSTTD